MSDCAKGHEQLERIGDERLKPKMLVEFCRAVVLRIDDDCHPANGFSRNPVVFNGRKKAVPCRVACLAAFDQWRACQVE